MDSVIEALRAALVANPEDVALRLHLASVLVDAARASEALDEVLSVLAVAPDDVEAVLLAARASAAAGDGDRAAAYARLAAALRPADRPPPASAATVPETAEELIGGWADTEAPEEPEVGHLSRPRMTLADVGGLAEVKQRLRTSFLTPMHNPELAMQFKKSLRGGLLLWGPPGCGKTFIARALAGELGADFYEIGIADVLDMYVGNSERNLQSIFDTARRNRPCLLFFDEIDALGQKRSQLRHNGAMRGVVNQMLTELDGATSDNEGLFFLAASNHPWDIDAALIRPGRFDRRLLVLPPDTAAREAILAHHLSGRPHDGLDLSKVAKMTEGCSGADLALVCEQATEVAMMTSLDSGDLRPITQGQLVDAARSVRPSIGEWMETAKNYVLYGNESGSYDELAAYLRRRR